MELPKEKPLEIQSPIHEHVDAPIKRPTALSVIEENLVQWISYPVDLKNRHDG